MITSHIELASIKDIVEASQRLKGIAIHTPLTENINFSNNYEANIFFKREDLQIVRSYKIRGAYNKISSLPPEIMKNGVVCASAGNHAQGVAYACNRLNINAKIFMPVTTPSQKVKQVKMFGKQFVEVIMVGDTFDEANQKAFEYCRLNEMAYIHPFDDMKVIEGQGTIGMEILEDLNSPVDYIFVPIGGGGLVAGLGSYVKQISPNTKIIGVEPQGAASMKRSIHDGKVTALETMDSFIDGAAVLRVGSLNYEIAKELIDDIVTVPEGKVCSMILKLYNEEAIVVEPAGALSLAALDFYKEEIKGKNVVCVLSGGNNDIARMGEIIERSLLYEGLKHYFLIRFPQRSGALRDFVNNVLGPTDDIRLFEYQHKINRESGPALVGVLVKEKANFDKLLQRMKDRNLVFEYVNDNQDLLRYIM